jgi:hypothetical protein
MNQAFSGVNFDSIPLTAVQQPERKRLGRPQSLREGELWGARSAWLDLLDRYWAQVGWEIGRAKNLQQLRAAFEPIQNSSGRLDFFVRPSISRATTHTARSTQKNVWRLNEQSRRSGENERELRERLDRARNALQQAKDASETAHIESIRQEREQVLLTFSAKSEKLQQEERDLRNQMMDQWAYIAQNELLSFIHSGRYTINPLNLANAMAGLPQMGWRQSTKRCQKLQERPGPGFGYSTFKLIERVYNKSSKRNFLTMLKAELRKQPKKNFAAMDMKRNWYYLQRAVKDVLQEKMLHGKVPFRVMAEYRRYMSSRTSVDLVFEEEERLI